jgi:hypothetical protein
MQRFTDTLAKMKLPALYLGSSEKSGPADATSEAYFSGRRLDRGEEAGGQRAGGETVFPATAHGGRRRPISSRDGHEEGSAPSGGAARGRQKGAEGEPSASETEAVREPSVREPRA